jgi:hypothetical protein
MLQTSLRMRRKSWKGLQNGFQKWFKHLCSRWQKCIVAHWDYVRGNVPYMIVIFPISRNNMILGTFWKHHVLRYWRDIWSDGLCDIDCLLNASSDPLLVELLSKEPTVLWACPVFCHLCLVQYMCMNLSRSCTERSLWVSVSARMELMRACEVLSTPTPANSFPINEFSNKPLFPVCPTTLIA